MPAAPVLRCAQRGAALLTSDEAMDEAALRVGALTPARVDKNTLQNCWCCGHKRAGLQP